MKTKLIVAIAVLTAATAFSQCPPPPAPTVHGVSPCTPELTVLSPYEIHFQVDPIVTGQQGFHAQRSPDNGRFATINSGYPNGVFFDSFELEPGHEFCYETRAYNSCGNNSAETNVAMITLPVAPEPYKNAPAAPTHLSATSQSGPAVVLNWTAGAFPGLANINAAPGGQTAQHQTFQIQRSSDGITYQNVSSFGIAPNSSTTPATYTDKTVSTGSSYYYRVRSFNQFGWTTGFYGNCGPNQTTCGTAFSNVVTVSVP